MMQHALVVEQVASSSSADSDFLFSIPAFLRFQEFVGTRLLLWIRVESGLNREPKRTFWRVRTARRYTIDQETRRAGFGLYTVADLRFLRFSAPRSGAGAACFPSGRWRQSLCLRSVHETIHLLQWASQSARFSGFEVFRSFRTHLLQRRMAGAVGPPTDP